MPSSPDLKWCRRVTIICSVVSMLFGLMTIVGWTFGLQILASIRVKYIPMAPSTALGFTLLGLAALLRNLPTPFRVVATLCIAFITALGAAKLIEFFFGWSFGLEEWIVRDPAMFGAVRTGRMSPIAALNFLLLCAAIFSLLSPSRRPFAGFAAAMVVMINCVVMLGYLYGTPFLYGGKVIPVALPTAIAFLFLSIGLIAAAGVNEWPLQSLAGNSARALLLRWFLPITVGAALLNGLLRNKFLDHVKINPALVTAVSTLVFAFVISAIISEVAAVVGGRIDRAESERNQAQAELEALNQTLEKRIASRPEELRMKNAQMEEDLTMARELQIAMLPQRFPTVPEDAPPGASAVQFCSFYYPTGVVSGDFFDVFAVSDTAVGVFICDVMGHGVRAALVTSMMRGLVEEHSGRTPDPGE
ncbi:MAG: SpoIIE family protein phosphatase, partial [Verrucomicrobiota bacterium]|nr:SpoIIE family protein phosphatase [Verrucomicrobiota bacterium]